MNLRRRDNTVHLVTKWIVPYIWDERHLPRVDEHGCGLDDGNLAWFACGRAGKLNPWSANRATTETPTCVACLIVDAFGKDFL